MCDFALVKHICLHNARLYLSTCGEEICIFSSRCSTVLQYWCLRLPKFSPDRLCSRKDNDTQSSHFLASSYRHDRGTLDCSQHQRHTKDFSSLPCSRLRYHPRRRRLEVPRLHKAHPRLSRNLGTETLWYTKNRSRKSDWHLDSHYRQDGIACPSTATSSHWSAANLAAQTSGGEWLACWPDQPLPAARRSPDIRSSRGGM